MKRRGPSRAAGDRRQLAAVPNSPAAPPAAAFEKPGTAAASYPIRGPALMPYPVPVAPPLPRELTELVERRGAAPVLEILEEIAGLPGWRRCSRLGCTAWTRGEFCPKDRP